MMDERDLARRLEQILSGASPSSNDSEDIKAAVDLAGKLGRTDFSTSTRAFRQRLRSRLEQAAPQRLLRAHKRSKLMSILNAGSRRAASVLLGAVVIMLIYVLVRSVADGPAQPTLPALAGLTQTAASSQEAATESPSLVEPTAAKTPLLTSTETPAPSPVPYCDALAESYEPTEGWELFCNDTYEFAFDYPQGWVNDVILRGPRWSPPGVILNAESFHDPDVWNMIRVDTFRSGGRPASTLAKQYWAYTERTFGDEEFDDLIIAGQPAYAFIVPWVQDTSGVYLFFIHGEYNTVMELKIASREGLEVNWEIARSIQALGSTPDKNYIPQDLIDKSFTLLP